MDKKEAAKQRLNERTASKRFKLPEGDTTFRVLPNARGLEKAEFIEYRMHSNVGARNAYLRCGKKMSGEGECWLCDEQIPKLEKSGKKSHRAAAEKVRAKDCFAVQIIYQVDGKWVGPTLWEMSAGVANKLLAVLTRRDVSHPQKGYNLTISRKGTTMTSTKYGDIDRDDEKSEVPEKLLAKLKPFGEVLKKYDEEVMKAEYFGHEQEEEEEETKETAEEEEEETPKKKPAKKPAEEEEEENTEEEESTEEEEEEKPKAKKKPKPAEEEEEEATEEEDDNIPDLEEEEEEKPAKKAKKPKDEEEEESESESEEEEEEKPKAKKKPKQDEEEESEEDEKPKSKKKPKPEDDDNE